MDNRDNLEQATFTYHWHKVLYTVLFVRRNLTVFLSACLVLTGCILLFGNMASSIRLLFALTLIMPTISLLLLPILQMNDDVQTSRSIGNCYKNLVCSTARLTYASLLLLFPFVLFLYIVSYFPTLISVNIGPSIFVIALFLWPLLHVFIALDYDRLLRSTARDVIKAPWRYFTGFGRTIIDACRIWVMLGVPVNLFLWVFSNLVEEAITFYIYCALSITGYLLTYLILILVPTSRLQYRESR